METTIDKRMRKRMIMLRSEQNRVLKSHLTTISLSKSFDERESALDQGHNSPDDERDDPCDDSSLVSDCVSEMRRRRIYETAYGRPYSEKSVKKKHSFYHLEEELPRPAVLLSPSFSDMKNHSFVPESTPSSDKTIRQESSCSSKKNTARVLWKVEATNLTHDVEALVLENYDERQRMKDSFINDEIMDGLGYEDDEIMTPVRIKKFIDIYDEAKNDEMEREGLGQINVVRPITYEPTITTIVRGQTITPTVNEATVTEISEATQALAAFVTSAVGVMKEAKTPEKHDSIDHWSHLQNFEVNDSKTNTDIEVTVKDQDFLGVATPFNALKLFKDKAMAMAAATPANKLMTKIPTPMTTKTVDSNIDDLDLMVTKLGHDSDYVLEKMDDGVLWPSLFQDSEAGVESCFVGAIDPSNRAMLEALVEGGALKQEIDGKNMLKLFIDMYHNDTFEKIVYAIQELKGLQGLIICRAIDNTRQTYRTSQEIESLFDATRDIQHLESLMLLNFDSGSMTNLAMMIHGQSSLYRLQIQMLNGTLNGELLGVMATSPKLTHIILDIKESCSLGTLMNSKTLESMRVNSRDLELKNSHVRTLIYSLQTNFTLTTLDLSAAISLDLFRSLCITLRRNYRLESLRVNLELTTKEDSSIAALELENLFRENKSLLNVWNYSYQSCDISAPDKHNVFAALRSNKTMQEFKFFSKDIGDWKDTNVGNPFWLKRNLGTPTTDTSTIFEGTNEYENGSFYSLGSTVETEQSILGIDSMPFCGTDCSTFSPPFDCSTVTQMRYKFQNWANNSSNNFRRAEV